MGVHEEAAVRPGRQKMSLVLLEKTPIPSLIMMLGHLCPCAASLETSVQIHAQVQPADWVFIVSTGVLSTGRREHPQVVHCRMICALAGGAEPQELEQYTPRAAGHTGNNSSHCPASGLDQALPRRGPGSFRDRLLECRITAACRPRLSVPGRCECI